MQPTYSQLQTTYSHTQVNLFTDAENLFTDAANLFIVATNLFTNAANLFIVTTNLFTGAASLFPVATNLFTDAANLFTDTANSFTVATNLFIVATNFFTDANQLIYRRRNQLQYCSHNHDLHIPALKKPNLDPNVCLNYRPIFNQSYIYLSKTLERLVSAQIVPYLEQSGFLPPTQSAFRVHHSSETVLLALLSDIYTAIDRSQLSLLALFDVSAAFDMVDHELLLQHLHLSFGIDGTPFNWIKSYLTARTQMVIPGNTRTPWVRG